MKSLETRQVKELTNPHTYFDISRCEEASLQYGLEDEMFIQSINERRLYLYDEICSESVGSIITDIMLINRMDRGIPVEDRKPIILYISSVGGSVPDGFGLIDVIENSTTPIYTVNMAYQYSMAFLIGIAGKKRYAFKNSTFLMHDGSSFVSDSTSKCRDVLDFQIVTGDVVKKYVLSHTRISEELYDSKYRIEWYTYAEQAKEYGFIDYIIGEDCDFEEIV